MNVSMDLGENLEMPQATQKCPFCAEYIAVEAKKCKHCGETVCVALRAAEEAKRSFTSSGTHVFMNAGGASASSSASSSSASSSHRDELSITSTKSRLVAALLAFFLGTFGIHKFYLGQTGWGILYLLFCWTAIPTVVSLIEGCLYLLSTKRQFALKYG